MRRLTSVAMTLLLVTTAVGGVGLVGAAQGGTTAAGTCSFPVASTDATGTTVTVENRPARVVTLAPSAAQTMWEIGGRSQVVGVSQFADFLDGASNRTVVTSGSPSTVRVEAVVGLDPDLVIAPNTVENGTVRKLRDAGLTVYRFESATSVEDVYEKTRLIGRLTGNCAGAADTVESMRTRISAVREAVSGREKPPVFYAMGGGYTAGPGTFIHEILVTAGARNVAAAANISFYGQISDEVLIAQDPEYIVVSTENESVENPKSLVPDSAAIRETTAYREGNIVVVNTNYVSQPAPRIVRPIETIARALHPAAFPSHEAGTEAGTAAGGTAGDATATTTDAGTATGTPAGTGANTPGFGATAAAVALMVTALLARRRR